MIRERMVDLAWMVEAPSFPYVFDLKRPFGPESADAVLYEWEPIDPPEEWSPPPLLP